MQKNIIIAVALSILFLILWTRFYQIPRQQALIKEEQTDREVVEPIKQLTDKAEPEKTIDVVLEKSKITFTSRGGAIRNYILVENGSEVDLVFKNGSFFETYPDTPARMIHSDNTLTTQQNINGILLTKTYFLNKTSLEKLEITVHNITPKEKAFNLKLKISDGLGTDKDKESENIDLNSIKTLTNKKPLKVKSGEKFLKDSKWLVNDNRYFLLALLPSGRFTQETLEVIPKTKTSPPKAYINSAITLKPGQKQLFSYRIIINGKSHSELKKLSLGLERTVDFGLVGDLAKLFLLALTTINGYTKNYGWAIIILSIIIQLVTLPLSIKSLKATAEMRRLQPYLKEIQVKFKNDPKRLNIEIMNLYKTHRVNPLSGCLPMLLQLPIFWALFNTLTNTFELRNASWILWLKDLSTHDPYYVLPILMGLGMFAQQMMSGATTDPQSKTMAYIFPAVFTFMFLRFPSGVVLYWLTNSVLTILIQLLIIEKEIIKEHHKNR